jgi:hypothetical protein
VFESVWIYIRTVSNFTFVFILQELELPAMDNEGVFENKVDHCLSLVTLCFIKYFILLLTTFGVMILPCRFL